MTTNLVDERNGGYYVAGSRVSLESIVTAFRDGATPETIAQDFELLTLGQIYGAITFYLNNRTEVDDYLRSQRERWKGLQNSADPLPGGFEERLKQACLSRASSD